MRLRHRITLPTLPIMQEPKETPSLMPKAFLRRRPALRDRPPFTDRGLAEGRQSLRPFGTMCLLQIRLAEMHRPRQSQDLRLLA